MNDKFEGMQLDPIKAYNEAIKGRRAIYPYEFLFTWADEGGTISGEQGQQIKDWLVDNVGALGDGWVNNVDPIGFSILICIAEKEKAMAFRLAWSHLSDTEAFFD